MAFSNNPILPEWRKDDYNNKHGKLIENEPHIVTNGFITLNEIPDQYFKVNIIDKPNMYEIKQNQQILDVNTYKVFYDGSKKVMVHPSLEGELIHVTYHGLGIILIPSTTIYDVQSGETIDTVKSLQDFLDSIKIIGWQGDYDNTALYFPNAIVYYPQEKTIYRCIALSKGNLPTNTTYWQPMISVKEASDYANSMGNYAQQQGDLAKTATENANIATADAVEATQNATTAITDANNATTQILNETLTIKKPYVNTFNDIATTYPSPQNGWETVTKDTNTRYRYNGNLSQWIPTDVAPYDKIGDLSQITQTNLVDGLKDKDNKIGILTNLNTTNKADLVGAINENTVNLNDKANKTYVDTQIQAVSSGSPKGVYSSVSALQSAFPTGNSNTYLVSGNSGVPEIDTLTITAIPTTAGNITITLNGVAKNIAVDPATDTTTSAVATKIRNATYTGWITGGTNSTIIFTKTSVGINSVPTYSAGTTGATGTIVVTTAGTNSSTTDLYYWNGSIWADGGVYQSTGIANGSVPLNGLTLDLSQNIEDLSEYNSINISVVSGYYWNISAKQYSANADLRYSELVVEQGEKYLITGVLLGTSNALCTFLDANRVQIGYYIKGVSTRTNYTEEPVIIPQNAKYMVVADTTYLGTLAIKKLDIFSSVKEAIIKVNQTITDITSKWYGKTWNVLGDSITLGYLTTKKYFEYVAERLGISTVNNYGISGSTIIKYDSTDSKNSMAIRYINMADADLITVLGGTNDAGYNVPLGTMADRTVDTFYGACHVLFKGLKEKYPTKTILAFTPIQRDGVDVTNYVNAYKQVCAYYSIPCLDLFNAGGLCPRIQSDKDNYIPDGTHPNAGGHQIMANKITPFVNNN